MQLNELHPWDLSPKEAVECQKSLIPKITLSPGFHHIRTIAGADASYQKGFIIGGIILLSYPDLTLLDRKYRLKKVEFPYVSGLLTFREGPVFLDLFRTINWEPDIILFDGQGIAHPRCMGIATHMGIWLDRPTIGCAKSRLIGSYASPGLRKGDYSLLFHKGRVIGAVLRTREQVKPLFISPGNHMNLEKSIEITLSCLSRYRIPEPVRQAHLLVNQIKRDSFGQAD